MAKTKPIGVRFDEELLKTVKEAGFADSPQKALNLYERSYLELIKLKVEINNQPENKERILAERSGFGTNTRQPQESDANGLKSGSKSKIQNFNEQPKSNYSIDTTGRPQKMEGEDSIDYAGRLNEWKKSQNRN